MSIGIISKKLSYLNSFFNVMLRSFGVNWDLIKKIYEIYNKTNFKVLLGKNGDSYGRY